MANSFVHLVMYFYYGCTTLGLKPFANVVTELQLTQFVTMMLQAVTILALDCAYPHRVTAYYLGYIMSLFGLFRAFYTVKYVAPKKAAAGGEASPKPGSAASAAAKPAGRRGSKTGGQ